MPYPIHPSHASVNSIDSPDLKSSVYADDICILASVLSLLSIAKCLQDGVDVIESFLSEQGMSLSSTKSAVLLLH